MLLNHSMWDHVPASTSTGNHFYIGVHSDYLKKPPTIGVYPTYDSVIILYGFYALTNWDAHPSTTIEPELNATSWDLMLRYPDPCIAWLL